MVNPTYTVQYEHDDNGDWLVTVPDVPSAHTFGRTLSHAREMAREVIALVLDVEPDAFGIRDEVLLGAPADRLIREAREARARAEVATAEAQAATLAAIDRLDDLTVRDAAEVLGVSFQRVHQLRAAARAGTPRRAVMKPKAPVPERGSLTPRRNRDAVEHLVVRAAHDRRPARPDTDRGLSCRPPA